MIINNYIYIYSKIYIYHRKKNFTIFTIYIFLYYIWYKLNLMQ
jgi:hypothetical protein